MIFYVNRPAPFPLPSAIAALVGETSGFSVDFRTMLAFVRDRATPANAFVGDPNDLLTYTSPSTKWIRNAAGLLESGTTLRTEYDSSGNPRGVLIEGQRTNILLRSDQINDAAWSGVDLSVSANVATAPDGTATADKLVENTATAARFVFQVPSVSAGSYAVSSFGKAAERPWTRMIATAGGASAYYNLSDGSIGTVVAGSDAANAAYASGWRRASVVMTLSTGSSSVRFYVVQDDSAPTYLGDGASGLYVWRTQLEAGGFASSPIKTEGSAVTRAADQISIATSDLPYNASEGMLVIEARTAAGSGTQVLWQIDDGTENERIRIVRDASNVVRFIVTDGGAEQCNLNLGTVANSTAFKVAVSWAANDFAGCLNGGTVQTDTSGTLPTVTTMRAGRGSAADGWFGHVASARYLPRNCVNNAELQGMST